MTDDSNFSITLKAAGVHPVEISVPLGQVRCLLDGGVELTIDREATFKLARELQMAADRELDGPLYDAGAGD